MPRRWTHTALALAALVSLGAILSLKALSLRAQEPSPPSVLAPQSAAIPQTPSAPASDCGAAKPKYKLVEKTVCVPEITMVTKVVKTTECRPEIRECCLTMTRHIPHTTYIEKECCVMKPEPRKRIECYTVCKPIIKYKETTICASEPVHTITPSTRCVSKAVPEKERRTRIEDEGEWIEQPCPAPCKPACKPGCKPDCQPECPVCTKKIWIPKPVEKEYFVTVWRQEWVNEPYNKVCTTLKPVTRCTVVPYVAGYCKECKTREVSYTECVPCKEIRRIPVTTYTCETVPVVHKYTVMVPHCVEKEIQVPVCRMVTKTITCQVPCCE